MRELLGSDTSDRKGIIAPLLAGLFVTMEVGSVAFELLASESGYLAWTLAFAVTGVTSLLAYKGVSLLQEFDARHHKASEQQTSETEITSTIGDPGLDNANPEFLELFSQPLTFSSISPDQSREPQFGTIWDDQGCRKSARFAK